MQGAHPDILSQSKPIELNFNRTGLSSVEFGNLTKSNSHKKFAQSKVRFPKS